MSIRGVASDSDGAAPREGGAAPIPSRAELETIARQWISLWCVPVDWELFDRLHAEDFEDCSPAGRDRSKQNFAGGLAELVRVFPDLRSKLEDLVIDDTTGRVAVRWSAVGTNRQTFLGLGPTGKRTPFTGVEIIEVRDGRIVRRWGEWDVSAHMSGTALNTGGP